MNKYKIYRNLHNGKLSIQCKKTNLIVGHCTSLTLKDTEFKVNEAGVNRIRKNKIKEVVAVAIGKIWNLYGYTSYKNRSLIANIDWTAKIENGEVIGWDGKPTTKCKHMFKNFHFVTFNPYKYKSFIYEESGKKIASADWCYITSSGLIITDIGDYNEK